MDKIGIIAGRGKFPILFAQEAKKKDLELVVLAVKGDTSALIKKYADSIYWFDISEFKKIFEIFKKEDIKRIVMAGQINPRHIFGKKIHQDSELVKILEDLKDKKADTIFGAIAKRIESLGIEIMDSSTFLKDHMPAKAVLTKREPTFKEWDDIYFGLDIAKVMGALDIGQTVVVKDKIIVAVEALEGTDLTIWRGGKIAGSGIIVVKVSKPKQDVRFDIPVIGLNTIKNLIKAKAACLAIEASKTLFLDKEDSLDLADRKDISIVSV